MTSYDNDESLFVSDDDNEMSTPTSQSNNTTSMTGALSSAFGASSQPAPGNLPSPGLGASFSPKLEEPKPSVSPNPFGPLFPSASSQSSSVSPPAPSLNPFAKPFSPLPSARTTEKPTPSPPPVSNGQPASIFSSGAMLAQSKAEEKAPSPAISSFQFPGVSQPSKPASPFPSGNALAQAKPEDKASTPPAATPFQFPGVSKLTSQSSSPGIFSNIQQPTPSTTSPFSAPQLPATVQPSGPTAGQSSTSVFDTAKPTPASEGRAPVFSFSTPEPVASKPQASASEISISQPPPQPTQAFPSFQPEKKKEGKSILRKYMTRANTI
jgi:hypothetical protein